MKPGAYFLNTSRESPFYTSPNLVLMPHSAGSVGAESMRVGHAMVDEFARERAGEPFRYEEMAAQIETGA